VDRSATVPAAAAKRARIVLLAAEGVANSRIAELVHASLPTVLQWRNRYMTTGIAGLADARRPGRPRTIDQAKIVTETLKPPPKKLGVTHWSTRLLARRLGVSDYTVAKAWRAYGIKPWRAESFRFSADPELVGKVTDICGLYLAPPANAIVLCVDEKSQIQALSTRIIGRRRRRPVQVRGGPHRRSGTGACWCRSAGQAGCWAGEKNSVSASASTSGWVSMTACPAPGISCIRALGTWSATCRAAAWS
jgi:transposase